MGATSSQGTETTKTYERLESGVYPGRCIQVIELGTQDGTFNNQPTVKKELMITWEISELMEDGRPFVVTWRGTNSLNEKSNLFKLLTSWRGKQFTDDELKNFELKNLLDKCCLLNITKNKTKQDREYNKIVSIMPLPKGMECIERVGDLIDFGIGDIDKPVFNDIWPWIQNIILQSHEAKGIVPEHHENPDEEIPF